MYVDPAFREMLDAADPDAKDWWQMSVIEAREAMSAGIIDMRPPVDIAEVRDLTIPTAHDPVRARLYRCDAASNRPLLVFIHGGGWMVGTLDDYDRPLRRLVNDAAVTILSVDYRLAPEHPFPAGVDDAYTALVWASEHRAELGGADGFLAIAGDSSGGNIAGAVSQRARDAGGPHIDHQILIYPVVARRFETPSYRDFGTGYFLTQRAMEYFWATYVGTELTRPPYADLLATEDLRGLAPATIVTCSLDPLCADGEEYADALAAAGVPVTLIKIYGLVHGAWLKDARSQRSYELGLDIAAALRRSYNTYP